VHATVTYHIKETIRHQATYLCRLSILVFQAYRRDPANPSDLWNLPVQADHSDRVLLSVLEHLVVLLIQDARRLPLDPAVLHNTDIPMTTDKYLVYLQLNAGPVYCI